MFSEIHHIGHITDDFERTLSYYKNILGGSIEETSSVDGKVDVAFIEWPEFRVEVISRSERGTYLDELMDALLKESSYHLAVIVPDITEAMERLEAQSIPLYNEEPVTGLGPYVRAFPDPDAMEGLPIELIEFTD